MREGDYRNKVPPEIRLGVSERLACGPEQVTAPRLACCDPAENHSREERVLQWCHSEATVPSGRQVSRVNLGTQPLASWSAAVLLSLVTWLT